jgi:hypothetical protein
MWLVEYSLYLNFNHSNYERSYGHTFITHGMGCSYDLAYIVATHFWDPAPRVCDLQAI